MQSFCTSCLISIWAMPEPTPVLPFHQSVSPLPRQHQSVSLSIPLPISRCRPPYPSNLCPPPLPYQLVPRPPYAPLPPLRTPPSRPVRSNPAGAMRWWPHGSERSWVAHRAARPIVFGLGFMAGNHRNYVHRHAPCNSLIIPSFQGLGGLTELILMLAHGHRV